MTAPAVEDEPKPLFAATMASLERGLPPSGSLGLPAPLGRPSATPPGGLPAHPGATAAVPTPATASGRALPAFDASDGATQIESPAFEDEAATAAEPVAAAKRSASMGAVGNGAVASSMQSSASPPPAATNAATDDEDDDLSIGEVSRVVNLSDLMRSRPADPARSSGPIANLSRTGAVPRMGSSGSLPRLGASGSVPRIDEAGPAGAPSPDAASVPPPVATTHRRGLLLLIGASALLLAGVVVAVVLLGFNDDDITTTRLARGDLIDTSRPDDPLFRPAPPPTTPEKPASSEQTTKPSTPTTTKPRTPSVTTPARPDPVETPTGASLRSDEIEEIARKNSMGTQRCYMRSQKGADAILIGDVKKIQATLDIAPDGTVRAVTLSDHATNNLGKCLISTIKSWRFRASPGGLYKISLQFG